MTDVTLPNNRKSRQPFIQWHKSSLTKYRELLKDSSGATLLLTVLIENMNDSNAVVVSQKTLSELLNCNPRSIRTYVKKLEEHGFINVLKIGTSNVYHVNPNYFWQQAKNKKYYSKINASVILSSSEQTKSVEELSKPNHVVQIPKANETDRLVILDDEEPPSQDEMDY